MCFPCKLILGQACRKPGDFVVFPFNLRKKLRKGHLSTFFGEKWILGFDIDPGRFQGEKGLESQEMIDSFGSQKVGKDFLGRPSSRGGAGGGAFVKSFAHFLQRLNLLMDALRELIPGRGCHVFFPLCTDSLINEELAGTATSAGVSPC
jgi:hypothetical protein